jgi:hypothetical protein
MEVIYSGLFCTPERVANTAIDEDVDAIAMSLSRAGKFFYIILFTLNKCFACIDICKYCIVCYSSCSHHVICTIAYCSRIDFRYSYLRGDAQLFQNAPYIFSKYGIHVD